MPTSLVNNPVGSAWHRWDPHIHAPGTVLNDQFGGDWEGYLSALENSGPRIRALGVTDYCCIQGYRQVRQFKESGRLADVFLLFPNVEFRLGIETERQKPINIHLIFSPNDPAHEVEIDRIIGKLKFPFRGSDFHCTVDDLRRLGRAFDPTAASPESALCAGVTQFKTTLSDLHGLFKTERWMRENCLVAVASKSGDGTSGLQADSSWAATRREIESFADIILGANPNQRAFWLGLTPGHDRDWIEQHYRELKPCLHGSDAHRLDQIDTLALDRFCWIKGDLTFETLRQAVIEPAHRVAVAPTPPVQGGPADVIESVSVMNAPWIVSPPAGLNRGLIAIIGARGSGKTALADIIATGAASGAPIDDNASFLKRAADHLGNAAVTLTWGDGGTTSAALSPHTLRDDTPESVKYLSQHFVDSLCSSEGLAISLRREMERVIFDNIEQTARMEATSFDELIDLHMHPIAHRRRDMRQNISSIADQIVQEEELRDCLPAKRGEAQLLSKQIDSDTKLLAALLPKDQSVHAVLLGTLERAVTIASARVEALRRKRKTLGDLQAEVNGIETVTEPARHAAMKSRFNTVELHDAAWADFQMRFAGDVRQTIAFAASKVDAAITTATVEPLGFNPPIDAPPSGDWPLNVLIARRDATKKLVGIGADRQRQYDDRRKQLTERESKRQKLEGEIQHAQGSDPRRKELIEARREAYRRVVATIVEEEDVLKALYAPVRKHLEGKKGALSKLEFSVKRHVDIKAWCSAGETLFDKRVGTELRGIGTLQEKAEQYLLDAWTRGSVGQIVLAMERFRGEIAEQVRRAPLPTVTADKRRLWFQRVAAWLYDTDHIRVQYGIEYEGVAIEHLSPGTRGVVLLLLYLAIDRNDSRPLIIDQPEENLDPNSVHEELVPHFREARTRRQVIVVTHNANLVVNTDADQIIVARSDRAPSMALPEIRYESGAIENKSIRAAICEVLEGGERAFLERERRYRLKWGESLALEPLGTQQSQSAPGGNWEAL